MSVGIGEIDVQHRKMIRKINEIAEAVDKGMSREEILEAINFFEVYSEEHFTTEEAFMTRFNYPEYPDHKKIHEAILADMARIRDRFKGGKADAKDVYEEGKRVADWFVEHMKHVDSRLAAFLRGKIK
jgi:hemerythrin-like metal-binding protein